MTKFVPKKQISTNTVAATIAAVDASTVDGTYGAEEAAVIADLRTKLNSVVTALKGVGIIASS